MNIALLNHTPDPERQIALAARLCYSPTGLDELQENIDATDICQFIDKIMSMGHHSVLEHASFTFGVEGISRVTSHQLVRHRVASYSQQSQRYVDSGNHATVTPPSIKNNKLAQMEFELTLQSINHAYHVMTKLGIPAEDARYILPNATETKIIMTMNARELLHFFKLRCCNRAQWEIRAMADRMLELVKEVAPTVFSKAGAACVSGPCPEGPYCCGSPKKGI